MNNTITLYRPVGLKELELIMRSGWKAFPPRLDWQPIFYPVLHEAYAAQIAAEWNTVDAFSGHCGIVTAFDLLQDHFERYAVQNVGAALHDELWIPAAELDVFNQNIVNGIRAVRAFFGPDFQWPENETLRQVLQRLKTDEVQ